MQPLEPKHAENDLPPDSLMRIPLIKQMLADPIVEFVPLRQDDQWVKKNWIPKVGGGFRPFYGEILYPCTGRLATWLQDPSMPARPLNVRDSFINEIAFTTHDYLHTWAYAYLRQECGLSDLGYGEISSEDIERLTFLHLLTEAVATVGLDYWYLCTVNLNEVCDLGTYFEALAVTYRKNHDPEFQKMCPDLNVHSPEFYSQVATFYCSGQWLGFDLADVKRSPLLLKWLQHELGYGRLQRRYTRQWLRFLAGLPDSKKSELEKPVACDTAWHVEVMASLGNALWQKVKHDVLHDLSPAPKEHRWISSSESIPDFRFINVNHLDEDVILRQSDRELSEGEFNCFFSQYVGSFDFEKIDKDQFRELISLVFPAKSIKATLALMKGQARLPLLESPHDIFFLS